MGKDNHKGRSTQQQQPPQTKSQKKQSRQTKPDLSSNPPPWRTANLYPQHYPGQQNSFQAGFPPVATRSQPQYQPYWTPPTNYSNLQPEAVDTWRCTNTEPIYNGLNPQASVFTPYQPLRFSTGEAERNIVSGSRKSLHTVAQTYLQTVSQTSTPHPTATSRSSPHDEHTVVNSDIPVKSIEQHEPSIENAHHAIGQRNLRAGSVQPPAAPSATAEYLMEAIKTPARQRDPRKLLVILDLNGTLLYRHRTNRTSVFIRPGVPEFLDYLFKNHFVMVYTSTRSYNAQVVVEKVLKPYQRRLLVAIWARDMLDLTPAQYDAKVQVYKKLDKVWNSPDIQATASQDGPWDQTNTVLIDDSHLKALAQPYNLLQVAEYTRELDSKTFAVKDRDSARKTQERVMKQLELQLEALKRQVDVSRLIRKWLTGRKTTTGAAVQAGSIQCPESSVKEQEALREPRQLLTPRSSEDCIENIDDDNSDAASTGEPPNPRRPDTASRSVSPISEDTFKELLGGLSVHGPITPPAEEKS